MPDPQATTTQNAIKPFLISNEHLEWIFKSLAAMVIPALYYIIQINGNYTELQTRMSVLEKSHQSEKERTNSLVERVNETNTQLRELKISIEFLAKNITELKNDNTNKLADLKNDLQNIGHRLQPIPLVYPDVQTFASHSK